MLHYIKPYFYRRFKTSFSKSGEDIQLWQLIKKNKGTYIDIGGHHPIFANNTYFFYLRGWRGLIIEPNPIFKQLYQKFRNEDDLYTGGVADLDGLLDYYEFEGSERNTFSDNHLRAFDLRKSIKSSKKLPVKSLRTLCSEFFTNGTSIDFISIDVEGMELEVIQGNDWLNFRPKYILLESHQPIEKEFDSEITKFLNVQDYQLIGKSLQGYHLGTLWFRANEVQFPQ